MKQIRVSNLIKKDFQKETPKITTSRTKLILHLVSFQRAGKSRSPQRNGRNSPAALK